MAVPVIHVLGWPNSTMTVNEAAAVTAHQRADRLLIRPWRIAEAVRRVASASAVRRGGIKAG